MAITGQNIADKAEILLQDESNVRWSEAELLGWINSGQREIAIAKPTALTSTTVMSLATGTTKQAIPATGTQLLDVIRNMGTSGSVPGKAINSIDRSMLDTTIPTWHSDSNTAGIITHYVFDRRNPKSFYVYPKAPATALYIEILMAVTPTSLASLANAIAYDDLYETVLIDYVLYRAYGKDGKNSANMQRSAAHYQAFVNAIGLKDKAEATLSPNPPPPPAVSQ